MGSGIKSVTIKDPKTGDKLIKVYRNKEGYFVEARTDLEAFECLIVTGENERITIPVHMAQHP